MNTLDENGTLSLMDEDTPDTTAVEVYQPGEVISLDQHKAAILKLASEYQELERKAAQKIVEMGRHLVAVRDALRHDKQGGFEGWVEEELNISRKQAYRYINVFVRLANCSNLTQLALPQSALYLLAEKSTPVEVREDVLHRAEQGEQLTFKAVEDALRAYRQSLTRTAPNTEHQAPSTETRAPGTQPPQTVCGWCDASDVLVWPMNESGVGICKNCCHKAFVYFSNAGHLPKEVAEATYYTPSPDAPGDCRRCQWLRSRNSSIKGVAIPDGTGKCTRVGGHCDPHTVRGKLGEGPIIRRT